MRTVLHRFVGPALAVVLSAGLPTAHGAAASPAVLATHPSTGTDTAITGTTADDTSGADHRSVPLQAAAAGLGLSARGPSSSQVSSATLSLGEGVHVVGVRWTGGTPSDLELRLREPGRLWGAWHDLGGVLETGRIAQEQAVVARAAATEAAAARATADAATDDAGADARHTSTGGTDLDPDVMATEGDVVIGAVDVEVRVRGAVADATLETWTTKPTATDAEAVADLPVGGAGLVVGTRADWGADESLRGTDPVALVHDGPKLGVTVHHTATQNGYAAEEVPALLRAVYFYHAQTLAWGDIGYGTLVDRFGRAWEGRAGGVEHNLQLAHAYVMNRDWAGISVLGDHETAQVEPAELATLAELTAWTLDTHGVDVGDEIVYTNDSEGWTRTVRAVHGHLDAVATTCPGMHLYSMFEQVRAAVAAQESAGTHAVQRVAGEDRYASAAALAQRALLEGTDTAYLASGVGLVDALAVGPVAAEQDAAVLLTRTTSVPAATLGALESLGVSQVRIVGGEAAVGPEVEADLVARGFRVTRFAGADRYAVAAALSVEAAADGSVPGTVYLASGQELADALGGASAAAHHAGAVLLTRPGRLPAASADRLAELAPERVVVLGGGAAVSGAVVDEVRALLPAAQVDRIGGADRYATSALVADDAFGTVASAVAASGIAPADAMAGTQLAARHDGPLVLVQGGCRPAAVDAAYGELGVRLTRLAGGPAVLDWAAGSTTCG
ncbi:cell wall-binding repeat-containing protein [Ornithinimicrobium avium]|uniref:Peptidoglycan recognition protein family domain-containing protein n=1 Tax=Ornithinimicrobium avium TaxID=2283195 RepID=A0A345NP37_9MICO|nr:cell wall-binding repeat-containing protein [Ornithinimicrobium avium]AXH96795.1 hypothetical protein DV701_12320 [Ornithinimicrobium avium]